MHYICKARRHRPSTPCFTLKCLQQPDYIRPKSETFNSIWVSQLGGRNQGLRSWPAFRKQQSVAELKLQFRHSTIGCRHPKWCVYCCPEPHSEFFDVCMELLSSLVTGFFLSWGAWHPLPTLEHITGNPDLCKPHLSCFFPQYLVHKPSVRTCWLSTNNPFCSFSLLIFAFVTHYIKRLHVLNVNF